MAVLVDPNRFRPIENPRQYFPDLGFSGTDTFTLQDESLLVTDPTYLADVYNPSDDPVAVYLWLNGVFVSDFGGDTSCPVWWLDPFLLLPLSQQLPEGVELPETAKCVAEEVGCDSGSFLFLPLRLGMPTLVDEAVRQVLTEGNGARINLPSGLYRVFYEQHEPPAGLPPSFGRNIVVVHVDT